MKKILTAVGVLALIAGIAVFMLVGNLDKIVKGGLETVGSELLGVPVKVASVNIELKTGTGQISGVTIANPAGFPAANAFQMDTIPLTTPSFTNQFWSRKYSSTNSCILVKIMR